MTLETPAHALRFVLPDNGHFVDLAVATDAANTAIHVGGVIKVGVVGNVVDLDPRDRNAGGPAVADRLELGVVLGDLRVTGHTRLRVRNIGVAADFDEAMTEAAIETELADMDVVLESDGLRGLIADARIFWREIIPDGQGDNHADDRQGEARLENNQVRRFWKNVGH